MTNTNKTSHRKIYSHAESAEFTQKKSFNLTQISQISQIFCPAEIAEMAEIIISH